MFSKTSKKRKQTPQSATLHDFFSKAGPSSANKKPKLGLRKKSKGNSKCSSISQAEIIVIESDEESTSLNVSQIAVDSSSDIEILEGPPASQRAASSVKPGVEKLDKQGLRLQSPPKQGTVVPLPHLLSPNSSSFGQPSVLLTTPHISTCAQSIQGVDSIKSSFHSSRGDVPGTAEEPYYLRPHLPHLSKSNDESHVQCREEQTLAACLPEEGQETKTIEVEQSLTGVDESWGTGDDEMEFMEPEHQSLTIDAARDEVDIDLTLDEDLEAMNTTGESCPICCTSFEGRLPSVCHVFSSFHGRI